MALSHATDLVLRHVAYGKAAEWCAQYDVLFPVYNSALMQDRAHDEAPTTHHSNLQSLLVQYGDPTSVVWSHR